MKIIKTGSTDIPTKKRLHKKRRMVIIAVVLVLLAAGGAGAYYYWQAQQSDKPAEDSTAAPQAAPLESSEDVDKQIQTTDDNKEKAKLYLDLSSAKQREGDVQAGLDAVLQSIELHPTHLAYAAAGALYAQLGDTAAAIDMYRKALELTEKTDNPNQVSFYNDYRLEIKALGGEV